jgi:acetyltransferase-like isoleucine patch superfamily enzyme
MTDDEFIELCKRNAQSLASVLMQAPRVWGKPERIIYKSKLQTNDTIFNTESGTIEVGENVFFGHGVMLLAGSHNYKIFGHQRAFDLPRDGYDIVIEEGVWIASGAIVIGPAHIGKHAVIAAGSVISGTADAYGVYKGIPARKVADIPAD